MKIQNSNKYFHIVLLIKLIYDFLYVARQIKLVYDSVVFLKTSLMVLSLCVEKNKTKASFDF